MVIEKVGCLLRARLVLNFGWKWSVVWGGALPYLVQHQLKVLWSEVVCSRLNI